MKAKIVRFRGSTGQGDVYDLNNKNYTRLPSDQPLAMHLYMVSYDEKAGLLRESPRLGYPPSVYEMAGGKDKPVVPVVRGPQVAPGIEDLDVDEGKRVATYGGRQK
jgi:hypothetical protein